MARLRLDASHSTVAVLVILSSSQLAYGSSHQLVRPLSEFGGKVFSQLSRLTNIESFVFSPISAHVGLSMILLAAKSGSETELEIAQALGYASRFQLREHHKNYQDIINELRRISEKDKEMDVGQSERKKLPIVDLHNILVTKNQALSLNKVYQREVEGYYNANVTNIDDSKPETKQELISRLNGWAKEAGFLVEPLNMESLNKTFMAMILSAINVESSWHADTIREFRSLPMTFYEYDLLELGVLTNRLAGNFTGKYREFKGDKRLGAPIDFRAIEMPLSSKLTFAIFQPLTRPRRQNMAGEMPEANLALNELLNFLLTSDEQYGNMMNMYRLILAERTLPEEFYISMPKFRLENRHNIKTVLEYLGVKRAFSDFAELKNINTAQAGSSIKSSKMVIQQFSQSAMIQVTASGIRPADSANSAVPASISTKRKFEVDSPFMFLLAYNHFHLLTGRLTTV